MPTQPKIYIDLDRTILNTDVFHGCLWHYLHVHHGVDSEKEKERAKDYYRWEGDMYDYDFFSQFRDLNLDNSDTVLLQMTLYLREQFLYFEDSLSGLSSIETVSGDISLLTFGNQPYQQFKLSTLPELSSYPVVYVQKPKGEYFEQHHPYERCILIDDKALDGTLPSNVDFYQIIRTQPRPIERHGSFVSIRKLTDFKGAVS